MINNTALELHKPLTNITNNNLNESHLYDNHTKYVAKPCLFELQHSSKTVKKNHQKALKVTF